MAVAVVAARAAQVAARYGPAVVARTQELLKQATANKVSTPAEVPAYVGNSPQRLKVATEALIRAGVRPDDVLPVDLVGQDKTLLAIRASAEAIVNSLQNRFQSGSDKTLQHGEAAIAADALRRKRVEAALGVYGSADRYFLCHPNGGIPAEDFVWYRAVILRRG